MLPLSPPDTVVEIDDGLYGASSERMLGRLHDVGDDVASIMLIGHNPGLELLASLLIGGGDVGARRRLASKFPTGALATFAYSGGWSDLSPDGATLEAFVVPREL